MQQPAITESRIILPSGLEIALLDNSIPESDVLQCVRAHNSEWRSFFELTPRLMRQRLSSGELFPGIYKEDSLVGYLETMSHFVEIPDFPDSNSSGIETALQAARNASEKIRGNYFRHAPNGEWPDRPENANVMRFVSINVIPEERNSSYGGQIIEYIKQALRMPPEQRPAQLRDTAITLTDTPIKSLPQRFHKKYGALDTQDIELNFRPGYDSPDIKRLCYSAPGFKAPLGIKAD